jgi:parallel beta-helix repeat protein/predicted outer membrane repeat protein
MAEWVSPPLKIMTRIPLILSLLALLPASAIAQNTWYVPDDFPTIQAGIDGVANGDTVIVRDGTYVENINFNGMAITLKSENGPATTIIDGNQMGSVVRIESGEGSDSVFEGFTVTNGSALEGGGMYCHGASPTLENCTFTNNTALYYGGGMYCWRSSPTLDNCTFTNNTADNGGGMTSYSNSSPTLENCMFTNNTAGNGGGMYSIYSSPTLENCIFTNNTADNGGGGMSSYNASFPTLGNCIFTNNTADNGGGFYCASASTLENCMFTNNTAGTWGGGMYCRYSSSLTLENCTFTNNMAGTQGGGINCASASTLDNCILWDNHANVGGSEIYTNNSSPTVTYSDVKGGWSGTGNIDADPLFVDPANNDFHLLILSPCIDTGNPNSPPDADGSPADMGAFPFEGLKLHCSPLIPGQIAHITATNATPNKKVWVGYSLVGGGPHSSPWGDLLLSPPITSLSPRLANSEGQMRIHRPVPSSVPIGQVVWMQAFDAGSWSLSNGISLTVQ